jgi:uncharacterized membrane protein YsdA (DUF1294 family)/cold shock CspA family protein
MRFEGHIKSWTDDRGFGFIEPSMGGQEIFVHVKSLPSRFGRPQIGQLVSFEVELNHEGKKRAKHVEAIRVPSRKSQRQSETPAEWGIPSVVAIPLFVALYAAVAVRWQVSTWFAAAYVALSVICFFVYAFDKSAARAGRWRVSEANLHFFSLIGGWPGALLAQQLLRHKCNKKQFRSTYWGTVCANVAAFVTINSPLLPKFYL